MPDPRSPSTSATRRLFIALWPDAPALAALAAWRDACGWPEGSRPTPPSRWHVTLHFLGQWRVDRLPALADALALAWSPVTIAFPLARVWHGGIAVLEPGPVPEELLDLHARLAVALRGLGFEPEARPWRPHLTLGRRAPGLRLPADGGAGLPVVSWRADHHALVASAGGQYTTLRAYPARPPGTATGGASPRRQGDGGRC